MINGILTIYKESGYTSHDVVAKMRGILKQKKIGHTGTLDPDAVGVLPLCLGNATRLCDMLTDKSKEYEAEMLLGVTTDTQDTSGAVLSKQEAAVTEEEVRRAVHSFVGEYDQIPPMYSALKVNGRKLYELAREGREIERQPRKVFLQSIEILEINMPYVTMRVVCSKGTYIRTLCHDIGAKLGCGAAMASLTRTRVGQFTIESALKLSEVEALRDEGALGQHIIATDTVFADLDAVIIQDKFVKLIENGNVFYPNQIQAAGDRESPLMTERKRFRDNEEVRVYDAARRFYGIYAYHAASRSFRAVKLFLSL